MPSEPRNDLEAVQEASQESLGSLRACLVEGDAEQQTRERRVRRRALVISVAIQSLCLAAILIVPLFAKTERLVVARDIFVPIPPYGHPPGPVGDPTRRRSSHPIGGDHHFTFPSLTNRPVIPSTGDQGDTGAPIIDDGGGEQGNGPVCTWCVNLGDNRRGPAPPAANPEIPARPRVIRMTSISPALLVRRVEPVYPTVPKQMHREGRVELRAIIDTDGSIQSLEVVSGDPLFYRSAIDAVSQWRYRPTILNGQAVEIDTYITVIYTMQH